MMKQRNWLTCLSAVALVVLACGATALLSACRTSPSSAAENQTQVTCPICEGGTVAGESTTLTATVCPTCRKVGEIDTSGGYLPPQPVYSCPKCRKVVTQCPKCRGH